MNDIKCIYVILCVKKFLFLRYVFLFMYCFVVKLQIIFNKIFTFITITFIYEYCLLQTFTFILSFLQTKKSRKQQTEHKKKSKIFMYLNKIFSMLIIFKRAKTINPQKSSFFNIKTYVNPLYVSVYIYSFMCMRNPFLFDF